MTRPFTTTRALRRDSIGRYGAWFLILRTLGEGEGRREHTHALSVAGERPERHAPWTAAMELVGARGREARGHAKAWDLGEKNAGKVGELTNMTETARTARPDGFRVEVTCGVLAMATARSERGQGRVQSEWRHG